MICSCSRILRLVIFCLAPGAAAAGSSAWIREQLPGRISLEVDRNGQKRPSEAPERHREYICRGRRHTGRERGLTEQQRDPPPGDLLPGTGSSCSRILRLDPDALPEMYL